MTSHTCREVPRFHLDLETDTRLNFIFRYHTVLGGVYSALLLVFSSFALYVMELIVPDLLPVSKHVWPAAALLAPAVLFLWPSDALPVFFRRDPRSRAGRYWLLREVGCGCVRAAPCDIGH